MGEKPDFTSNRQSPASPDGRTDAGLPLLRGETLKTGEIAALGRETLPKMGIMGGEVEKMGVGAVLGRKKLGKMSCGAVWGREMAKK